MWALPELVLLLLCLLGLVFGGWQKIPVSTYQYNFVAAAWGGTASVGVIVGTRDDSGVILYTSNGGSTWTSVTWTSVTWTSVTSTTFPPMTSVAYLSYSGTDYFVALGYDSDSGYATSFVSTD
jgi:hypothetical protein